jgi:hypothetical protein
MALGNISQLNIPLILFQIQIIQLEIQGHLSV